MVGRQDGAYSDCSLEPGYVRCFHLRWCWVRAVDCSQNERVENIPPESLTDELYSALTSKSASPSLSRCENGL